LYIQLKILGVISVYQVSLRVSLISYNSQGHETFHTWSWFSLYNCQNYVESVVKHINRMTAREVLLPGLCLWLF